jgi:hypothetical protein
MISGCYPNQGDRFYCKIPSFLIRNGPVFYMCSENFSLKPKPNNKAKDMTEIGTIQQIISLT